MQKSKLGISVGLLGAAMFLICFFGGYLAAIVLAGYILLFEENGWIKKMAVRGVILMFLFSLLSLFIGFIPQLFVLFQEIVAVFNISFYPSTVHEVFNVFSTMLSILEKIVYVILGVLAVNQRTIPLPVIDSLVAKHMD